LKILLKTQPIPLFVIAPPSKSSTIRLIITSILALKFNPTLQKITINNFSVCDDVNTAISIAINLGYLCDNSNLNSLVITRNNNYTPTSKTIILNCKESALCYRIFSTIAPYFIENYNIIAEGTLLNRIKNYNNSFLPIPLSNQNIYEIDCSQTSQQLTALLLYLSFQNENSIINAHNVVSSGYIDLTIDILTQFGIEIQKHSTNNSIHLKIIPKHQSSEILQFQAEGD